VLRRVISPSASLGSRRRANLQSAVHVRGGAEARARLHSLGGTQGYSMKKEQTRSVDAPPLGRPKSLYLKGGCQRPGSLRVPTFHHATRAGTGHRTSSTGRKRPSPTHHSCSRPHSLHLIRILCPGRRLKVRSSTNTPEFTSRPVSGHVNTIIKLIRVLPLFKILPIQLTMRRSTQLSCAAKR